jgi:aspartate racemase
MHIGLIGGIGPAATDFYYRGLVDRYRAAGKALELTMAHADVGEMGRNLGAGATTKQAEIFAGLIGRMKAAGAEVAAVTSMGGHFCIDALLPISPLPLVHGVRAVAEEIKRRDLKTVGIIGTRTVMNSALYGALPFVRVVVPEGALLDRVHDHYVGMANVGVVTDAHRQVFFEAGRTLCQAQGAEAVMLGGTDLFLAFQGQDCGFPAIDCADIHVEAIFRHATAA